MKGVLVMVMVLALSGQASASGLWLTAGSTGKDVAGTLGWMTESIGLMITAADTADDLREGRIPRQDRPATRERKYVSGAFGIDLLVQFIDFGDHGLIASAGFNLQEETTLTTNYRGGEAFRTNSSRESAVQGGIFYTYQPRNAGLILGLHSTVGAQAGLMYWF